MKLYYFLVIISYPNVNKDFRDESTKESYYDVYHGKNMLKFVSSLKKLMKFICANHQITLESKSLAVTFKEAFRISK